MRRCALLLSALWLSAASAAEPVASGLKPGQRPGPYTSIVAVGTEVGRSHCFVCATADRPAVIIFTRRLTPELGTLARGLDKALAESKATELRAWVTVLSDDQPTADAAAAAWARKEAVRTVPVGVFEDAEGPPAYRLSAEAEVTVLLSVKQKVVRNFAFRPRELTEKRVSEVLDAVKELAAAPKK